MSVTWDIFLDIDRDGVPEYQARNDGLSLAWSRGRKFYLDQAPPGRADITLDNVDRKYNPKNTGSAIYPDFTPGVIVEIRGTVLGTTYTVYHGFITDIDPRVVRNEQVCMLLAYDIAANLQKAQRFFGPIYLNTYEGLLVRECCRNYGMREQDISVDTGPDAVPVMAFNRSTSLLSHIEDIRDGAHGLFYVNGSGLAVYEDRHHRLIDDHATSQFTFTASQVIDATPQQRVQGTINHAIVSGAPRVKQVLGVAGSLTEPRRISNGERVDIFLPYNNWATGIVTPVATTDYTANLTRDGSNTDKTGALVLLGFVDQGYGATVQFENTDSLPVWLTLLQVRGELFTTPDTFAEEYSDTESIHSRGEYPVSPSPPTMQSKGKARDFAEYLVRAEKDRADEPEILLTVAADGDDTLAQQLLVRELSDRITVQAGVADIDGDYFIEEKHLRVDLRGASFVGEYRLRRAPAVVRVFRLDADASSPADSGGLDAGQLPY